jgi:hypothetical protein
MATPPEVQPFVEAARRYVERALSVPLDGSEESLAYVDHYVAQTVGSHEGERPLGPELLALVAPALGAYFGEVAIARYGGRWVIEGADPVGWRVELGPAPSDAGAGSGPALRFFPVGMAAEALRGGEVEGYDAGFTTREDLMGPLLQALEAAPPVDEAYYYSLTGRLETLGYALDLVTEIEHRQRQRPN